MNKASKLQFGVFCVLVAAATIIRILFRDVPNIAPVAAISLFAGYYFRSVTLACLTPISVMLISDAVIGTYEPVLMIVVYGMLVLPVALRRPLRRSIRFGESGMSVFASTAALIGCSLGASVAFFLVTNFAVWLMWYETNWTGLISCYVNAIPFFRYTVLGDLFFSTVLFAAYAWVSSWTIEGVGSTARVTTAKPTA